MQIYSDIRSYCCFDTNIFGYSFVSFFGYNYIQIFVRIENLYSSHPDAELLKVEIAGNEMITIATRGDGGNNCVSPEMPNFQKPPELPPPLLCDSK